MAAKNYTEILALVNAGNQMGLSNTIKRDYGIPLDFTSVQPSYDDAVIYAAENTKAYVGQPLSVGGKLYIINDVAAETKYVVGDKEYDNYLVEVGSATEGDGATIDLEAGVLTLHGFESALTGYLPRKAEDGTLEWVPISAVVQGDGNKVTTLTSEDGSVTITKKTDTDESLVYDLSVEAYDDTDVKGRLDAVEEAIGEEAEGENEATGLYKAIADAEARAKAYADENDANTVYDDTELAGRVSAIEEDYLTSEDKYDDAAVKGRLDVIERDYLKKSEETIYDDTALAGRVTTVEGKVTALEQAVAAIDYVDTDELADAITPITEALGTKAAQSDLEALKGRVDAFLTGDGAGEALDSLQELIAYIDSHDDVEIATILEDINAIEDTLVGIDTTVAEYVTAAIDALKIGDYAKAADLTALAGRVEALEKKPFDTYATKTEVETVDGKFANYTTTEALNGLLADKADADSVVANDTFESFKTENTTAIATAKQEAIDAAAEAEEAKGYAVAEEVARTYATKQDLTDHSNTMATTLNDYAKVEDVETELAKKVDTATITHTTETLAEGAKVEGTTLNIVVDAYTKAETLAKIEEKITSFTGGESAADVKLALENYEETNDARVGAIETKNGEQDTAIATAQAQADKGVADAAKVAGDLSALAGTVSGNTNDISAVKNRLTTLETAKGDHETRIATAEGKITSLETATANNASAIGVLQGKDTELVAEDERLAGLITGLQTSKANAADVYTKGEVDTKVQEAIDAIPEVSFDGYATEKYVDDAIAVVNEEVGKKANAADVYTITQADNKFVAETDLNDKIDARVNTLIDGANSEDTITNVTNLVAYVNDNAGDIAKLVSDVEANRTDIEGNAEAIAKNAGDIVAINELIAKMVQPKASEEISVGTDGTLGIIGMSTDKLVQGKDTLVLNGGDAGVKVEA